MKSLFGVQAILLLTSLLETTVSAIKYSEYILAPDSRSILPATIFRINGTVLGGDTLLANSPNTGNSPNATLSGQNSSVTYDFGVNVGGRVSFTVGSQQAKNNLGIVGLTYSESSQWVASDSSDATADANDPPYIFDISRSATYTVPQDFLRGGFRYLSITLQSEGSVSITNLVLDFTASPAMGSDLQQYTGYFHSSDELLNRIWYAGAYTTQLCTIAPATGPALVATGPVPLDTTITNGTTAAVDGAKRDRVVWPGDYSVSFPTIAVSTYDLLSVQNGIDSLFLMQDSAGQLPYGGLPLGPPPSGFSFTYHLYNLIAVANHYLFSGDATYLAGKWSQWKLGMKYSLGTIDHTGLMDVTTSADWLRYGMGGHNIEANSILYYTLGLGISLADALNDTTVVADYASNMTAIKTAINALLWNNDLGLYNDNDTAQGAALQPQDGNTWAIRAGVTPNDTIATSIASKLQGRWTAYGAPAPEAGNAVSPFISSFELNAHLALNRSQSALDLMRSMWGFMLNDPRMTNSTFIEGYSADGTLHYPPYPNDGRISYAHGWSTGPTYSLTTYVAGIQLASPAGAQWKIWPQPGNLTSAEAGFSTTLGAFSAAWNLTSTTFSVAFSTPAGTTGSVYVPTFSGRSTSYTITNSDGAAVNGAETFNDPLYMGQHGVPGGNYVLTAKLTA